MSADARLRFGIVGCGDIARFMAFAGWLNRGIKIEACVDLDGDRAASFARRFRIPACFTDYQQMLETVPLDVVYLAVPHYLHHPMILEALGRGKHVFCEKPVTINLDQALDICRKVKETCLKVGVNYQYRYDSGCHALARASLKGDLGRIYYSRCNVSWRRTDEYFTSCTWHAEREKAGGGTLITQASHALDILLWASPAQPASVFGIVDQCKFTDVEVEDLCLAIVEMSDGSKVQLAGSMSAAHELPVSLEVYGSRATGLYKGPMWPRVKFKGAKVKKSRPPIKGVHALTRSLEGFRRWVVDGLPYLTPVEESMPVLAVVEAAYRSAETGCKEEVDNRFIEFLE